MWVKDNILVFRHEADFIIVPNEKLEYVSSFFMDPGYFMIKIK